MASPGIFSSPGGKTPRARSPDSVRSSSEAPATNPQGVSRGSIDEAKEAQEEEQCIKCLEPVGPHEKGSFSKASKQVVHSTCVSTYKAILRKGSSDPKFSAWFNAKTLEEQAIYYKDRRLPKLKGAKRKLQHVESSTKEVQRSVVQSGAMGLFIPFKQFDDKEAMKGEKDPRKRLAAWRAACLDPNNKTMKYKGQLLLYEFQGVATNAFKEKINEFEVSARTKVCNKTDLVEARQKGQELVATSFEKSMTAIGELRNDEDIEAGDLPKASLTNTVGLDAVFSTGDGQGSEDISDIDLIIQVEEDIVAAEKELAEMDRIDMQVWEAQNKELVESIQNKEDDKNVHKTRVGVELRISQARSWIKTSVAEVKADSDEVRRFAASTLGANDWKEYPLMKEQHDKLGEEAAKLPQAESAFTTTVTALLARVADSSSQQCKAIINELGLAKVEATQKITNVKKIAASILQVLKKVEKSRVAGCSAQALDHEEQSVNFVAVVVDQLCQQLGSQVNTNDNFQAAWDASPKECWYAASADWAASFATNGVVKGLQRWLMSQKADKDAKGPDRRAVLLKKSAYRDAIFEEIAKATKLTVDQLQPKLVSATRAEISKVFYPQLAFAQSSWSKSGGQDYALGQLIFVAEGELLLIGADANAIDGWSYSKKVAELGALTQESLRSGLEQKTHIIARLAAGSIIFVPARFMIRQHALSKLWLLRWSVYDPREAKAVLANCLSMASSLPEIVQGTFQTWLACLQDNIASCATTSSE